MCLSLLVFPGIYSWLTVNRYCSTNTEYGVTIGFDYRVVGNASKPFMPECLSVKVSWIVMVATDEKKPVVGFICSLGIALDNILIVPFSLKAKATISSHDDQSIFHLILDTNFIHEEIEVPVDVATDDNAAAVWEIVYVVMRFSSHYRNAVLKRSRRRWASKPLSLAFLKKSGLGNSPIF